jgi:hypothetical protein
VVKAEVEREILMPYDKCYNQEHVEYYGNLRIGH